MHPQTILETQESHFPSGQKGLIRRGEGGWLKGVNPLRCLAKVILGGGGVWLTDAREEDTSNYDSES